MKIGNSDLLCFPSSDGDVFTIYTIQKIDVEQQR